MAFSSYGAATDSSGVVRILKDLDINVSGRDVLVVEAPGWEDAVQAWKDPAG